MTKGNVSLLFLTVAGAALWSATPATAQSARGTAKSASVAQPLSDAGTSTSNAIGEVVVTAQKRAENLQRVPIAISAYSANERDLIGIETIQDLALFTPGLSFGGPSAALYIRGIGRETNSLGTDPGVATYYNGVYESDPSFASLPTFLADHEEILRGPQGTLYGRNSIGGAVNVITKKPTDSFKGEFDQTIGNYDTSYTGLRISGPVVDKLDFLLAGVFAYQGQGYVHNVGGPDLGTTRTPSLEAQIDYRPNDAFNIWLTYDATFLNARPPVATSSSPYNNASVSGNETFNGLVLNPIYGYSVPNPGVRNIRSQNISYPGYEREPTPTQEATFHVDWNAGPVSLKYIGGVTRYSVVVSEDIDYTSRGEFTMPYRGTCLPGSCPYPNGIPVSATNIINIGESVWDWSNEVDLASNGNRRLNWIAGLYEFGEDASQSFALANPGQTELLNPVGGPANPEGDDIASSSSLHTNSYAAFAQADYAVAEKVTLTAGVRYTDDEKRGREFEDLVFFDPNVTSSNQSFEIVNTSRSVSGHWSGLSGKFDIQYTPNKDTNMYATYSRGYKSGGFALGNFDVFPDVKPEFLDDWEVGWKQLVGRKLQLNSAAYFYNYENMQVSAIVNFNGLDIASLRGVPSARSYGFEEEADWIPTDDLHIRLSYSYMNAKIVTFRNAVDTNNLAVPGPQNLSGQDLPLSPRNKIALNAVYTWHFEPGSLSLSGTYAWTDKSYAALFDTPLNLIPAWSDVDARVTWADLRGRYNIIAYVSNAFDTVSISSVSGSQNFVPLAGFAQARFVTLNPPRTFGLEAKYFF